MHRMHAHGGLERECSEKDQRDPQIGRYQRGGRMIRQKSADTYRDQCNSKRNR
jgi:hypothetical protein